jgi:hypothetical protein
MSMSTDYRVSALLVGLVDSKLGLFYVGLRACLDIEREVRLKHFSPFPRVSETVSTSLSVVQQSHPSICFQLVV